MKKIRVGVIGCGSISEIAHLPAINKYPETELTAVCDVNLNRAKEVAKKWQAKNYFNNYTDMLTKVKLDAVVIATPNVFHYEQALAVAKAGLPLLIEKPLAMTNKQGWNIVEAFDKAKTKIAVGCDRRFFSKNRFSIETRNGRRCSYYRSWCSCY